MSDRTAAAEQLLERFGHEVLHCRQVRALALSLFDQLRTVHRLGVSEREILEAAALLHDIGWSVSGSKHHKHSYQLIRDNAAMLAGFTTAQVELIANVARYHRKALPTLEHDAFAQLSAAEQDSVRRLAALLRLADGLDRPHLALVTELRCEVTDRHVLIHVQAETEAGLHVEGAARKRDLFEAVFGLAVEFTLL